jgi:hypothetical protein
MEYTITSMKRLVKENQVVEFTGEVGYGYYTATVQVPYNQTGQIPFNSTLLVTFAKPGFIGWLKRKLLA